VSSHTSPKDPQDLDLRFGIVDLIGRTGTSRAIARTVTVAEQELGNLAMTVPSGEQLEVAGQLESVQEGIFVAGTVTTHLTGECSRCLDPVQQDVEPRLDELFLYPQKVHKDELEDTVLVTDDQVDLGPLVRDAIAEAAWDRPLCRPDCPGLCAQCGARLENDPNHHHDVLDPRFAALGALLADEERADEDGADDSDGEGTGR
jgi:uncharacterized protein